MHGQIAYDNEYAGPAYDLEGGRRLVKVIVDKTVLFMTNLGINTAGESAAPMIGSTLSSASRRCRSMLCGRDRSVQALPDHVVN